eukprot:Amastigsp_a175915_34.p2 type:complete len:129 gc:universal Amastigsp_a175915_34:82-468(+)
MQSHHTTLGDAPGAQQLQTKQETGRPTRKRVACSFLALFVGQSTPQPSLTAARSMIDARSVSAAIVVSCASSNTMPFSASIERIRSSEVTLGTPSSASSSRPLFQIFSRSTATPTTSAPHALARRIRA